MNEIKKILKLFLVLLNKILIPLGSRFCYEKLIYLMFILNLREIKKISPKKRKYKVIVLSKLGGDLDLYSSQIKYNKNIVYYYFPRYFFKLIFNVFVSNHQNLSDYKYDIKNKELKLKKENYRKFLSKLISIIQKKLSIDCFIGFNFTYKAERELQAACENNGIKFLTLHKESVGTHLENKVIKHIYKNFIGRYNGHKIAVYNKNEKKMLLETKIARKNQIEIVGCSRLDECFKYRQILPKKKILYYLIDFNRGLPTRFFDIYKNGELNKIKGLNYNFKRINWKKLHTKIIKNLKLFAQNNKNIEIILKGKQGYYKAEDYNNLPKNFRVVLGGTGGHLLKEAKLIIGWNSTAVLEAIAANRFCLHPFFFKKNKLINEATLKLNSKKISIAFNEKEFQKKLKFFIEKKYDKKKINNNLYPLKYYLNNINGSSGKKLNNFILKNLN